MGLITVYDGVYHTHPRPVFHARYLGCWNSVGAKKLALGASRREPLKAYVSFGVGTLLVCRAIELAQTPQGCDITVRCISACKNIKPYLRSFSQNQLVGVIESSPTIMISHCEGKSSKKKSATPAVLAQRRATTGVSHFDQFHSG